MNLFVKKTDSTCTGYKYFHCYCCLIINTVGFRRDVVWHTTVQLVITPMVVGLYVYQFVFISISLLFSRISTVRRTYIIPGTR